MNVTGTLMIVLCASRYVKHIFDELTDWFEAEGGAEILLYGTTMKAQQGFLLVNWTAPVPDRFLKKLHTDSDMTDFVVCHTPPAQQQGAISREH